MGNLFQTLTNTGKRVTFQFTDENGTSIELIKIDATRAEEHVLSSKATSHEVEDGSDISDHVIKNGRSLTINGVISDHPINLLAAASGNIAGIVGNITEGFTRGIVTGATSKLGSTLLSKNQGKPSKNAMDMLDYIYEGNIPLTIITGLKTYTNMMMEKLNVPRQVRTVNALEFSASFREIRIVGSEIVDIPAAVTSNEGNIPEKKEGKKPTSIPDSSVSGKGSSLLFKIKGLL